MRWLLFAWVLLIPLSSVAAEPISRRDGFLLVWEGIRRESSEWRGQDFDDIEEGDRGYEEINFAHSRGIIDDAQSFRPDDSLSMEDALLWIFRTRNVAYLDDMQTDNLPELLRRYSITDYQGNFKSIFATRDDLIALIRSFDRMLDEEVHHVSYYADQFHGKTAAFGEIFDMYELTAAHKTFPENTLVKVTNVENGETVIVRINDRGPYIDGRDMDLSLAAFEAIAHKGEGILQARFERLGHPDLIDLCKERTRRYQKRITRNTRFHRGIPHFFNLNEALTLGANKYFVVRSIAFPDGFVLRRQEWFGPKERFTFAPPQEGIYTFVIGDAEGRERAMQMDVEGCG